MTWEQWADSPEFHARIEEALADVEAGRYDSFDTIDELIEFIDSLAGKGAE